MLLLRQIFALVYKNLLVTLVRHPGTTPWRAFVLPIIFVAFLSYARNLFIPPSKYGVGEAQPVKSLQDALGESSGGRETVVFVNNGLAGGNIDKVIDEVAGSVRAAGKNVHTANDQADLLTTCRSSLRGVSSCFAAAVFYSSPDEGPGGIWNYTLRADGGLGQKVKVDSNSNDVEIYILPLQHAVDFAIARQNTTIDQNALPQTVNEYMYTSQTTKERRDQIRTRYMGGIIDVIAVAFFIGVVGVIYQLVGLIASERELGMTQMIDASMPNRRRWEPQMARFIAHHLSFDLMFAPGWIVIGITLGIGIFSKTSVAIILIYHILVGLSLTSFAIFGATFFHKAQLSGIICTISALLLAVVAQVAGKASDGAVAILSLLFPPMNYVYFTIFVARWERQNMGTNLIKAAPKNPWSLPGIVFFVFLIIQIIVFPLLASFVERFLYGTASKGRKLISNTDAATAVHLAGFTKRYVPSWWARNIATLFGKKKETVVAVDQLDLNIHRGQIMVLLGANGSGKSTTLEAIAGLNPVTSGEVVVDGEGGLGICPQKNVLWDMLTAFEHVYIFNQLKSTGVPDFKQALRDLLRDCDLEQKIKAQARHLSGGQKRKLQLSMMLTGGSRVCCVDECSSGVDALARQKLWNILLNERGKRTIIFTTHFLDEADLLSDQIAILSKGQLKAQGSAVELKHRLGGGYRVKVLKAPGEHLDLPQMNVRTRETIDKVIYTLPDSSQTADCVRQLEAKNIKNYDISSPSIEEIFFNVAEDLESMYPENLDSSLPPSEEKHELQLTKSARPDAGLQLQPGKQTSALRQAYTLFRKRWTVFQRNYLPTLAAFLIPIVAAGLVTLFVKDYEGTGCKATDQALELGIDSLATLKRVEVGVGPPNKIQPGAFARYQTTLPNRTVDDVSTANRSFESIARPIEGDFNAYIKRRYANDTPGAISLDPPMFAFRGNNPGGDADIRLAPITQNIFNNLITNVTIATQYNAFDVPWARGTGKTLQLVTYFGLAMAAYPAFFALYPTYERLRHVRQLHYSNGVKSFTLWSAYLTFDFVTVLAVSVISIVIFRAVTDAWYHPEYLFVVFFLYGIASTLWSYVISLFAKSQLASFAFAAGGQAVMFLLYFIAIMSVYTYSTFEDVEKNLLIVHFTISLVTPSGNLVRALFVALNIFATTCQEKTTIASYPGGIRAYGGPILYLVGQSLFLFGVLLWWDSASLWARIRRQKIKPEDGEEVIVENDVAKEVKRVAASDDGLRVQHMTKAFGSNVAVQDVSFGVKRGEVFALLGPNGAGKSTTISLIRGDIQPSHTSGEIFVEGIPISKRRTAARTHLGVCPQVDACDQMTVLEHLRFYARVRGVVDVEHNVSETIRSVGLGPFQHRMAAKLSGGNKRKLSLAIALMGNPSVLLLDEPSSGMDVCAKRVMWRTLTSVLPGRSLLLTTHSMEEADALADRAGIIGRKMLAVGTSEGLRRQYGDRYHVHLITTTAPYTTDEEMARIRSWILQNLPGAEVEDRTFHGQLRFSVPAHRDVSSSPSSISKEKSSEDSTISSVGGGGIGALFNTLEGQKQQLGFEYFSVSQTTLDQVFLSIVGKHQIEEENMAAPKKMTVWNAIGRGMLLCFCISPSIGR